MISQLYEKKLREDLFKLSVITLITVLLWISFVTYKALSKSEIKPDVKKQIQPLTPTFDLDTMNYINQRFEIPQIDWEQIKPERPEILMVPETQTTEDSQTPTATESGELIN